MTITLSIFTPRITFHEQQSHLSPSQPFPFHSLPLTVSLYCTWTTLLHLHLPLDNAVGITRVLSRRLAHYHSNVRLGRRSVASIAYWPLLRCSLVFRAENQKYIIVFKETDPTSLNSAIDKVTKDIEAAGGKVGKK